MGANRLRSLMGGGGTAVNAWLSADSGYIAEVLSHSGYDAVTVDLQHGMFGVDGAIRLLQAIDAGPAVPMARAPSRDPAVIGKLLDAGAHGIVCPGVDTAEQAAAFVAACRYPPTGIRSYGPARAGVRGGPGYATDSGETVMTWAMVESAAALEALEAILAVPGLDGVYVGPNDLALSLGVTPGLAVPPSEVDAALRRVVAEAHAAGVFAGVFCADGTAARRMADLGYDLVTPGNDVALIRGAAAGHIGAVRGGSPRSPASGGY
ncbi:aldolase/citrate lyase family protein [Streptosporangium oxazolinicum]|uniref:Aldolase/citrate lyase family protein n=1 Tax=Streptosporangium oxazolinicum TaxID=909287 RepID=A0ABP8AIG3_9ACTN